ncbi:MAG: sigma-70 family RNA polymerase sigma factor [Oscillospiraceae bacterium]|nr:sigma-70 family RNA polymerase sigma factor [Oscillospiraceae bacterium]
MDEDTLAKGIYNKDEKTFEMLMNTYNKLLWVIVGAVLSKVGTEEDIEECISDVYLKLWENPKAFDPQKGSIKTFLSILAKNKALDRYRNLSKTKIIELNEIINSNDDDLLDHIVNKEMSEKLYEIIQGLKEPDREILIRRYFLDEKPSIISDKISIPLKEVKNRLYQNKLKLKKLLSLNELNGEV